MPLLASSPLALPEHADLEGAWQETFDPPNPGNGQTFHRVTPGETYEQVISAHFTLNTSAAAGTRNPLAVIQDPNGNNVIVVGGSAGQGPSTQLGWSVDGSGKLQYNFPTGGGVFALPPTLMLPGYTFFIVVQNQDAGDSLTAIGIVYLRIPTRAPQQPARQLLSTPAQV